MSGTCVLALDLGTTAFKAAAVNEDGVTGDVTVTPYSLDYTGPRVTCDPRRHVRCAIRTLRGAARSAREHGLAVGAIGISSQAQTFVPVDRNGAPVADAIVWTDARATAEAREAGARLPDFARTCGFVRPSPLQFLPKVMRFTREGGRAARFLLLNEWVAYNLTGEYFGDTNVQGMGGFYDVERQRWHEPALALAGIASDQLAPTASAARTSASLTNAVCQALGLPRGTPVYSCGNDQSCAAVGAGLADEGDLFCNFGTALVVYALRSRPAAPSAEDQIAGISPLAGRWFILGVESECGNIVEGLAKLLFKRAGIGRMLRDALALDIDPGTLPVVTPAGDGRLDIRGLPVGCRPATIARALLEYYSRRFGEMLAALQTGEGPAPRCFAGGGMSRSTAWLDFLGQRHGVSLRPTQGEHPGLVGIARIVRENAGT